MGQLKLAACLVGLTLLAFAQSDRGTITGTVADPAGAVVANAAIEVRNVQTGAVYQVASSATGNYVVQVPTGTYEVSVTVQGFKKYVRPNILVPVEQTLRIDASSGGRFDRRIGDGERSRTAAQDRKRRIGPQRHRGHPQQPADPGHR